MLKAYADHSPDLSLFPDARAALGTAASRGLSLGLITDGHAKTQARKVAALDLASHFAEIIFTGALGPDRAFHKPRLAETLLAEDAPLGPAATLAAQA